MNLYNDNSREATAWLQELVVAGHLPPATIDSRSILDIQPDELRPYSQCHFFAGIGGWPLALQLAGWPADQPVWTGSCPCQPFSVAGRGAGISDPRHLWPEFFRLIAECKPPAVFGEQVAGAAGRSWFSGVRANLEGVGYRVGAADLCAASIGAPHIRQRLFWFAISPECGAIRLADPEIEGRPRMDPEQQATSGQRARAGSDSSADSLANLQCPRLEGSPGRSVGDECPPAERGGEAGGVGEPVSSGRYPGRASCSSPGHRSAAESDGSSSGMDNTTSTRFDRSECNTEGSSRDQTRLQVPGSGCGYGGLADTQHDDRRTDQPRRRPEGRAADGRPGFWSSYNLIPCRDGKTRRVESGTFPLAYGVPGRVGLLRGYGNAIVPQLAAEFIRAAVAAINSNSHPL